jgi:hypothetical protein
VSVGEPVQIYHEVVFLSLFKIIQEQWPWTPSGFTEEGEEKNFPKVKPVFQTG